MKYRLLVSLGHTTISAVVRRIQNEHAFSDAVGSMILAKEQGTRMSMHVCMPKGPCHQFSGPQKADKTTK